MKYLVLAAASVAVLFVADWAEASSRGRSRSRSREVVVVRDGGRSRSRNRNRGRDVVVVRSRGRGHDNVRVVREVVVRDVDHCDVIRGRDICH